MLVLVRRPPGGNFFHEEPGFWPPGVKCVYELPDGTVERRHTGPPWRDLTAVTIGAWIFLLMGLSAPVIRARHPGLRWSLTVGILGLTAMVALVCAGVAWALGTEALALAAALLVALSIRVQRSDRWAV